MCALFYSSFFSAASFSPSLEFLSLVLFKFVFLQNFSSFFCRLSSSLLLLCFVFFSSIARKEQMAKKLDFGKTTGIKEHDDDSKYVIL